MQVVARVCEEPCVESTSRAAISHTSRHVERRGGRKWMGKGKRGGKGEGRRKGEGGRECSLVGHSTGSPTCECGSTPSAHASAGPPLLHMRVRVHPFRTCEC
eukprot:263436-Chlamydomonas_euryale.AAC.1